MVGSTGIAQVNIHRAKAASAVLARMFTKQHLGLALVQEPWYNQGCTLRTPRISHAGLCTDRGRSQAMWEQPRRLWWHRYTLPVTRRAHRPKSLHWQNTARGHTHPSSSDVMQMHMGQQRSESKSFYSS
ncbi:uncharacterized protein LOC120284348 isoform X2 [Drosophila simulans]|uniref:uncharacterized protein LOC120284348 isoform X2 n=1 Tax=Drosophila simulans TaxID=7240 RepID=UPI00192D05E9|nr:uncharacterized protein LOC120284348 isoform X2 [Drosophila simulans]